MIVAFLLLLLLVLRIALGRNIGYTLGNSEWPPVIWRSVKLLSVVADVLMLQDIL